MFKRSLFACLISCSLGAVLPADAGTFTVENRQEIKLLTRKIRAAQFLNQATFGATSSEIDALADRMMEIGVVNAAEEWIDDQFELSATKHVDLQKALVGAEGFDPLQTGINVARYRAHAWWHAAIGGEDQLRQRMAWALSQIFVVNRYIAGANAQTIDPSGQPRWLGIGNYYDMLVDNSFGNYRDCLGDVTYHPVMGVFLSHLRNQKADPALERYPDENYAREIQQLLSIGLYELNINGQNRKRNGELIPTYDLKL